MGKQITYEEALKLLSEIKGFFQDTQSAMIPIWLSNRIDEFLEDIPNENGEWD